VNISHLKAESEKFGDVDDDDDDDDNNTNNNNNNPNFCSSWHMLKCKKLSEL
jgi:hypothetical protein